MITSYAYIFDLDGTLVDSLQDITTALCAGLAAIGKRAVTPCDVQSWVGDGLPVLCRRAIPNEPEDVVIALAENVKNYYREHCVDETRPYPKVLQMLKLLQFRHAQMAVLSNKPHALVVQVVDQLNLDEYFSCVRGYRREEEKKPSPLGLIDIARELGCSPDATFFVGDSVVDIETARNAGMISVAVTWGFQPTKKLLAVNPDFVVDDPVQIPELAVRPSK